MGKIRQIYLESFIQRFDKDGIIQYLTSDDFKDLKKEEYVFNNSINVKIHAFLYFYDGYREDKIILFCPGIGPGHCQYVREIELLASRGYLVLTLDYCGCGESGGDNLQSVNEPTRDVCDLLKELKNAKIDRISDLINYEILLIGHSLGAYTALNVINLTDYIKKGVIISGFLNITKEFMGLTRVPVPFIFRSIKKYEDEVNKEYNHLDNIKYLKNTNDKLLFIHSKDDTLVPFKSSTQYVMKHVKNNNIEFLLFDNRKHNPNYTLDALSYMNETFVSYNNMVRSGDLETLDDKVNYMKSKDIFKMTNQDKEVWDRIIKHLEK